jgi:kynurenine formamidase
MSTNPAQRPDGSTALWQRTTVQSPTLPTPTDVVSVRDVAFITNAHRFQTLNMYLPLTADSRTLVGTPATEIPAGRSVPTWVHLHGGAWRDPNLTATSIEPAVAHAFRNHQHPSAPRAIVTLNYSLSRFPDHPTAPYDPIRDNHTDIAREAIHPQQISDVLHGFTLLTKLGLTDDSFVLSGHSAGAFLAFATYVRAPSAYGLDYLAEAPLPASIIGLNGLYSLATLVIQNGLGALHKHLRDDYEIFLSNAFGADQRRWNDVAPAAITSELLRERVTSGRFPRSVVLEQSADDQLVPVTQRDTLVSALRGDSRIDVTIGDHLHGSHALPWEHGDQMWAAVSAAIQKLSPAKP